MSKFFKALERAEMERALREQVGQQPVGPTRVAPHAPETEPEELPIAASAASAGQPYVSLGTDPPATMRLRPHEPGRASESSVHDLSGVDEHLVSLLTPTSFEAEQYRALRHLVEQRYKAADLHTLAVSSPAAGDGKTTTAINLAGALAQAPQTRVLLIEADLRRPSMTKRLNLGDASNCSLVDAILDPALSLQDVVRLCPPFGLAILPAGSPQTLSYELLNSPRLRALLEEARHRYDYVILDTPPFSLFPDCRLIEKWMDGFLIVVAAHKTPRKLVEEALSEIDPAKLIGFVFNNDDRPLFGYHSHYYYGYDLEPNGVEPNGGRVGQLSRAARGIKNALWRGLVSPEREAR